MSSGVVGSLNREVQEKLLAKYSQETELLLRKWFAELLPHKADVFNNATLTFQQLVKDGVALCEIVNVVMPGAIKKINTSSLAFKQMENITAYLDACEKLGVSAKFQTVDLYENKNMSIVQQNIHLLYLMSKGSLNKIVNLESAENKTSKKRLSSQNFSDMALRSSSFQSVETTQATSNASTSTSKTVRDEDSNQVVPGLASSLWLKEEFKHSPELEATAREWIEAVLGSNLNQDATLYSLLKSGVILCKLVNAIKPGSIPRINESSLAFKQMENIENYLQGCRSLGLHSTNIFNTIDLYENKGMSLVLNNIIALGNLVSRQEGWKGPKIRDTSKMKTLFAKTLGGNNEIIDLDDIGDSFESLPTEQKSLVAWANYHILAQSSTIFNGHVEPRLLQNLGKDVRNGLKLISLLQAVTRSQQIGAYEKNPRTLWQCMQNASLILRHLSANTFCHFDGCSAYDIVAGNTPSVTRLVVYIREKFDVDYMFNRLLYGEEVASQQAASKLALVAQEHLDAQNELSSQSQPDIAEDNWLGILPIEDIVHDTNDVSVDQEDDDGEPKWEEELKIDPPSSEQQPQPADEEKLTPEPIPEKLDFSAVMSRVRSLEQKILATERSSFNLKDKKATAEILSTTQRPRGKSTHVQETVAKQLQDLGISLPKEIPEKEIPEKEIPGKEIPGKEIHAKEIQAKEIQAKEIPAKEIPVKEIPASVKVDDGDKQPSVIVNSEPLATMPSKSEYVSDVEKDVIQQRKSSQILNAQPSTIDENISMPVGSKSNEAHSMLRVDEKPILGPSHPAMRGKLNSFTLKVEEVPALKPEESKLFEAQNAVRLHIASEILSTERSYVQSLSSLCEKFVIPLKSANLFSEEETFFLVANVQEIYSLHKNLLSYIENRVKAWTEKSVVSDIFLDNMDMFKRYEPYMVNFSKSVTYLVYLSKVKPELKKLIQNFDASQAKTTQLWLDSFLIMPVQRIPRYILLLKDLRKYTSDRSPDKVHLTNALEQLETILSGINNKIPKALISDLDRIQKMLNSIDGPVQEFLHPSYRLLSQLPLEKVKIVKLQKSQALSIRKESKHAVVLTTGSIFVIRIYKARDEKLPYKLLWGSLLSDMKGVTYFKNKQKISAVFANFSARFRFKGDFAEQFMDLIRQ